MLRASLSVVVLLVAGCHQIEPAPPPLRPRTAGGSVQADASVDTHDHDHEHAGPVATVPGAIIPRAVVEQVEPGQEALANAILAAAKPSMDDCRANAGGGVLRLRIVSDRKSEKITVDPGSTVSDSVRHCVLEALSSLDVPDTLSQSSPSTRSSSGFSSIFTIAW